MVDVEALSLLVAGGDPVDSLAQLLGRPSWHAQAACRGQPIRAFFSTSTRQTQGCARCAVRGECLEFALEHHEYGIWGGTTTAQRRARWPERFLPPAHPLDEHIDQHLAERGLSVGTTQSYRAILRGLVRAVDLETVTAEDVLSWIRETENAIARRNRFAQARTFLRWLVARGVLDADPTIGVAPPIGPRARRAEPTSPNGDTPEPSPVALATPEPTWSELNAAALRHIARRQSA